MPGQFISGRLFQSTLPRGSDCSIVGICSPMRNFNPRSLAGATPFHAHFILSIDISIHAPSRERPPMTLPCITEDTISIHAPSRERRINTGNIVIKHLISINAPSRERLKSLIARLRRTIFQSTLPRGSDRQASDQYNYSDISIHAPSRERRKECRGNLFLGDYFNPRSLAGATAALLEYVPQCAISIHAPSRERRRSMRILY